MKDVVFGATATHRYRVSFGTLEEWFYMCTDDKGVPIDTSKMRGLAWYVWLEEPYEGQWDGDVVQYGLAPTRRAAIGHAKTAVGL